MLVSVYCVPKGMYNEMDLPVTAEDLERLRNGELVQNVLPHLSPDQREFLISGFLPGEFASFLGLGPI